MSAIKEPGFAQAGEADLKRAIDWALLLASGQAEPDNVVAYQAWLQAHPRHSAAGAWVEAALGPLRSLRECGVSGAVAARSMAAATRRSTLRSGALAVAGVFVGGLAWQVADRPGLMADQQTGLAQRRQDDLPGGGGLWLDARTAVDVDKAANTVTLHQGQMLVQVPAGTPRPLVARTRSATLEARDARFVVAARAGRPLEVAALRGSVQVRRDDGTALDLAEGRHATLAQGRPPRTAAATGTEDLWTRGLIAMNDEPLGRLVEALQNYRRGVLQATAAAEQVRISGVFSLDDTERTLQLLVQTQPLRVHTRTRYWVTIEAA